MVRTLIVTGSAGLIGAEAVRYYDKRFDRIIGLDNNMRLKFFGLDGDTCWQRRSLEQSCSRYHHLELDVRDRDRVLSLFREERPAAVIHCAAQPSHDLAASIPFDDFEINAVGTLNLLEATRRFAPEAPFVFMSTNKVYGDAPNHISLLEEKTRYEFADARWSEGISEELSIDQSKHSLFGASKAAADILVQEYGRYFGMNTVCFRGGCLTGPGHSGAPLHGFLAYLFKAAASGRHYTVNGYKGKQVRDQIHSKDVVAAFDAFISNPRAGAVYNLGGGKENSVSVIEAIDRVEHDHGLKMSWEIISEHRAGDHICYYSDLHRFKSHYPNWDITMGIDAIFDELAEVPMNAT